MGVLNEIFAVKRSDSAKLVGSNTFFSIADLLTGSGSAATGKTALTISAFYNGVNIIANDIAKLPKGVYIKDGESRIKDSKHPINYLLNTEPNGLMTAFDFWRINVASTIIKGNGYSRIHKNKESGIEEAYEFLDYEHVKVYKKGLKLFYEYKGETIPSEDMLHFKGFGFDGLVGMGVVSFAAKNLGVILDANAYASEIYKDRGIGYGVIESDNAVESTNKKLIEDGFSTKMASKNKFKVPLLDEGMKYKSIQITPAEAQFLETNKYAVLEVCRWLNLNPHKLKDLSAGTYSNVYQQSIEHVSDSIVPWALMMQQEVIRKSFVKGDNRYFVMNINALLKGDLESKRNYYTAMVYAGIYTRNEVRALEEMNPIDGLDEILQPVNMQALSIANELLNQQKDGNPSK